MCIRDSSWGVKRRRSANRAAKANAMPRRLSHTGACTTVGWRRLRKRNCNMTATAPTAATTTAAKGLKKAARSVKATTNANTPHSKPEAITVQRRGRNREPGKSSVLRLFIQGLQSVSKWEVMANWVQSQDGQKVGLACAGADFAREPRLSKPKLWRRWNKTGTFGRGPKAAPVVLVHAFS